MNNLLNYFKLKKIYKRSLRISRLFKQNIWQTISKHNIFNILSLIFALLFGVLNISYTLTAQAVLEVKTAPIISFVRWCSSALDCNKDAQIQGAELTYQMAFTNIGNRGAENLWIVDAIPANADFKIDSVITNFKKSGLIFVIEYSSDFDALNPKVATWNYKPVSSGGGATTGYDRLVKAISWRLRAGTFSNILPDNVGDVGFVTKIR